MKRLMTGVDGHGRSCVVDSHSADAVAVEEGLSLADTPFEIPVDSLPSRPPGRGELLDLQVAPRSVQWSILEFEPGRSYQMHHTDTVDLDIVLAGSMELVLDDGVHTLETGDSVVMMGVDHAWRAGPEGCRLNVVAIGTPPLSDERSGH